MAEAALSTESSAIPAHVPPHLVKSFDFRTSLGDRPQESVGALHDGPTLFFSPELHHPLRKAPGAWIVTTANDVREVLGKPEVYSSTGFGTYAESVGETWLLTPLEVDPPNHQKYRKLINPLFSARRVVELEPRIRSWCNALIDDFIDRKGCDLLADFARKFPTGLFIDLMGLPRDRLHEFMEWEKRILTSPTAQGRADGLRELLVYLRKTIRERRENPTDDVISSIAAMEVDGRAAADDEIVGIVVLLYTAGLDTVTNTLAFVFRYLAEHPDLQNQLRDNPDQIPRYAEEMLRLFSPATVQRLAVRDSELSGVVIKAGDLVTVSTTAASRDPDQFPDPDQLNPARNPNPHFCFGFGIHRCVGAQLARRDIAIAVEEWLRRVPRFRMQEGVEIHSGGGSIMALDRVPLVWD